MSIFYNQDLHCSIIEAELGKITLHEQYNGFTKLLAAANHMLPPHGLLSAKALPLSLLIHPIVVIRIKGSKNRFKCIGGLRTLKMAETAPGSKKSLLVLLVDRPQADLITLMINTDILVSTLIPIRNPKTIGEIYKNFKKEELESLLQEGLHLKNKFAEKIDLPNRTLFLPKRKSVKSGTKS